MVEDDEALARVLGRALADEGHAVDTASSVASAEESFGVHHYDLVILDIGLPDGDGVALCRQFRSVRHVPILMLTARDSVSDRVAGLDAGADDYLTKPFAHPELAARVRALLRRPSEVAQPVLEASGIRLDAAAHTVWRGAILVPLTAREFGLLDHLMRRSGEVCRREDLLEHLWDANYDGLSNVVDVHVANLRRKLAMPGMPDPIETVRGVGYRIVDPEAAT